MVSKALLKSSAMTTTYGFIASMSLMVCSKVVRAAVVGTLDRMQIGRQNGELPVA